MAGLNELGEFFRRTGRNLARIPGDLAQGVQDFAQNTTNAAVGMAEPTMALMRGDDADQPLFPTVESGGKSRLGAVASALHPDMLPGGQAGTLGSYGGRLAQTAKKGYLRNAENAAKNGMGNEEIRQRYGWFQDPHGDWKFEINDASAIATRQPDGTWKLNHKALEKAYPDQFKALKIEEEAGQIDPATGFERTWMAKVRGSDGTIVLPEGLDPDTALNRIMHEVTHKVQDWEGFNRGGHPANIDVQDITREQLRDRWEKGRDTVDAYHNAARKWLADMGLPDTAINRDAFDQANPDWARRYNDGLAERMLSRSSHNEAHRVRNYEHLIGEVEARDVQERLTMSDAQRKAIPPYELAMQNSTYLITKPSDMVDLKGWLSGRWKPEPDKPLLTSDGRNIDEEDRLFRQLGDGEQSTDVHSADVPQLLDLTPEGRARRAQAQGYTQDAYHGTRRDFREFQPGGPGKNNPDAGIHVGDQAAANGAIMPEWSARYWRNEAENGHSPERRAEAQRELESYYNNSQVMPVKVKAQNPLDMPDLGRWDWPDNFISNAAKEKGWGQDYEPKGWTPPPEVWSDFLELWKNARNNGLDTRTVWTEGFRNILAKHGYDSVRYPNHIEGDGGYSHMLLEPNQVRSSNAHFDPTRTHDPDTLAARPPVGMAIPQDPEERRAWLKSYLLNGT